MVLKSDKKFLDEKVLNSAEGVQIFPYNVIMGKIEQLVEDYYKEFKLGITAQGLLANYGDRGEKFNKYFTECLNVSQTTTIDSVKQELIKQLFKGNDVKSAIKVVGDVIAQRTTSVGKLLKSLSGQMEQLMVLWDYQDEGCTKYRINAKGESCEKCQSKNNQVFKIEDITIGETLAPLHPNCDCSIEILDEQENVVYTDAKTEQDKQDWGKYLQSSLKQVLLGNYTDDVNLLGTILQVGLGLIGVDLPLDIRDLFYDVTNFEATNQHLIQTILDTAALLPVVGGIKYADEAGTILKSGDELGAVLKSDDEIADVVKAVNKTTNFADFPKNIHVGRQGKHIVGHNNYKEGKSIFTKTIEEAQDLINKYSGTGIKVGQNREMVDFEIIIGKYVDPQTGKIYDTTVGTIHYSKDGTHIVPERPKNWR